MTTNEKDIANFKSWLKEHLPLGPVSVTFIKKDGTRRVMDCTTDPTYILFKDHEMHGVVSDKLRKVNEDVCTAFDLKFNGWRSFRWDSIEHVGFTVNNGHYIQTR